VGFSGRSNGQLALAIGERQLPARLIDVSALAAPALLGGLLMDELGGAHWAAANWKQAAAVGVAGLFVATLAVSLFWMHRLG